MKQYKFNGKIVNSSDIDCVRNDGKSYYVYAKDGVSIDISMTEYMNYYKSFNINKIKSEQIISAYEDKNGNLCFAMTPYADIDDAWAITQYLRKFGSVYQVVDCIYGDESMGDFQKYFVTNFDFTPYYLSI